MIARITGRVILVNDVAALLDLAGVGYEIHVPAASVPELQRLVGADVTFFTIQYIEGNPTGTHLIPRLIGFLRETEREFFNMFVKVKGISMRRALRSMAIPPHQLAAAIEAGDERMLATLPEIGKKTAAQIVTDLRGKMDRFLIETAAPTPVRELSDAQKIALDILVQWGDRRADAQRWIAQAVESDPDLKQPEDIVRAAYRVKHGSG